MTASALVADDGGVLDEETAAGFVVSRTALHPGPSPDQLVVSSSSTETATS